MIDLFSAGVQGFNFLTLEINFFPNHAIDFRNY